MLERGRGNFPENQLQLTYKLSVISVKSILEYAQFSTNLPGVQGVHEICVSGGAVQHNVGQTVTCRRMSMRGVMMLSDQQW